MDPGRYGVQPGWDNNSALDRYPAVNEPNFRVDDSYDDTRYIDDRFPRDEIYPRNTFPQEPPVGGAWPQTRRRSYEDDYHPLDRDSSRRHESHDNVDSYHYDDFHERPSRYSTREPRDDYGYNDYDYRGREDSRERDYEYGNGNGSGRHSYDSDYERGGRREREGSWRRRGSRDRKGLSRERDVSPYRRSRSRGHDDRVRSRSPRSRSSHGPSYREDSYDDDRSDRRRDRDDYRHHEHYSTAQATEKRAGLGSQPKKSLDPSLEVQAGDSYRTLIQKKALARFREMS